MIDKSKALNVFAISEQEYDSLLADFTVQAEEKIAAMENALKNGDAQAAAFEMHSLKGVAGNMRLDDCHCAAIAVESALRAGDGASLDHWTSMLRRTIEEIRVSIRNDPHGP